MGADHSTLALLAIAAINHRTVVYARRRISVHGISPVTTRSASASPRVGEFPCKPRRLVVGRHPGPWIDAGRRSPPRAIVAARLCAYATGRPGADSTRGLSAALLLRHGTLLAGRANTIVVGGTCSYTRKKEVGVCTPCWILSKTDTWWCRAQTTLSQKTHQSP